MVTEPQRDFVAVPIQLVRHSRSSQITNNTQLEFLSTTFFLFVSFFTFIIVSHKSGGKCWTT